MLAIIIYFSHNKQMNEKEYLTQEKFDEFKKELDQLKNVRRKEVAESLEYSKALGDLAENAEYHEARDMQATIEDRIIKLEDLLKNAVIVSDHVSTGSVNIGSTVTVEKDGKTIVYTIVGSEEADVMTNKISVRSPFGQAILGKKVHDKFSFTSPNGELTYVVKGVR
jgi:transcription elongation factor GreA